jgi:hypothetical protein
VSFLRGYHHGSHFLVLRFQSPEGDSCLFYTIQVQVGSNLPENEFQSPEGDSCLFYSSPIGKNRQNSPKVSVPRRGFVSFLRLTACGPSPGGSVSVPRRGFVSFLPSPVREPAAPRSPVSVPRRGFVSFLRCAAPRGAHEGPEMFQSPEGDSCLFYPTRLPQIGRGSQLAATSLPVCGLWTPPLRASVTQTECFSEIRASPYTSKSGGVLVFLAFLLTICSIVFLLPTTGSGLQFGFCEHR